MGRRRSQSRHARARSACGVLWRWVAMSKRGQGRITLNAGVRQAAVPLAPLAQALALMLAAGGVRPPGRLQPGWFAAKGAAQAQTQASGRLPDGSVAGIPTAARQQTQSRQQLQQSLGNLNRTAAAIAAQQAAQAAARCGQCRPAVPDGLAAGGLQIDTQALTRGWTHAEAPKSSTENGRSTVTINQTADRAILNWQTFNVGRDTTVDFRQQAEWAVLNRVNDPAGRPSQIQGQIKAPGTVLIVNRNGVVFDGASQSTCATVAAAGRISDEQFRERGLYGAQARNPASPTRWARSRSGRARASIRTRRAASRRAAAMCCCWAARCTTPARSARRAGRRSCRRRQLHHPARRGHQREHPVDHAGQRDRAARRRTRMAAGTQHRPDRGGRGRRDAGRTPGAPGRRGAGHDHHAHARHHPPAEFGLRRQGQHRAGAGIGHGGADR